MALIEQETLAAVAATAAALSPRVRRVARQGVVYGLAGALRAGDVIAAAARGAARAAQSPASEQTRTTASAPAAKRSPSSRSGATPRGRATSGSGARGDASRS